MGNIATSSSAVKVLSGDGYLKMYQRPIRAADLMLENPGHFVCDSGALNVGHRIQGLCSDQALLRSHFYFLLPMELLYSVLTHDEMDTLNRNACKAIKCHTNFSCIIVPFRIAAARTDAKAKAGRPPEMEPVECLISNQKSYSWRPALETILETPCRLS